MKDRAPKTALRRVFVALLLSLMVSGFGLALREAVSARGLSGPVTGQAYFMGHGNPTDARIAYFNNDGTNQTVIVDNSPTNELLTGFPQELGVDTAAGWYFAIVNGGPDGSGAYLVRGSLNGGAVTIIADYRGVVADVNDDIIVNALHVDVINHRIYVGLQDPTGDATKTGIKQYTYTPATGAVVDNGFFVLASTDGTKVTTGSSGFDLLDVRDFDFDPTFGTTGTLYFTELLTGGAAAQGLYRMDMTSKTITLMTNEATFPPVPASDFSNGYIIDVEADSTTDLVYFSTQSLRPFASPDYLAAHNRIMYVPQNATNHNGTLLTINGLPAGHHFYPHQMVLDQVTRQLYVTSEEVDSGNPSDLDDVIYVFQLNPAGSIATLIRTISPNPPMVNNAANLGGMTYNNLPILNGIVGTGTAVIEQGAAVQLLTGAPTITDSDGTHLASATVQVTGGLFSSNESNATADRMFFGTTLAASGSVPSTNITWAYSNVTHTLTFTGYDTVDNYEVALAGVRFQSLTDNPTNYGATPTRTLTWTVSDGAKNVPAGNQNSDTTTVTITAVNDAPVNNSLTLAGGNTVTEDISKRVTFSVSDVDANAASHNITVRLQVTKGTVDVNTAVGGGVSAGGVTGDNTNDVLLTGTQNQINTTLGNSSGAVYFSTADYNGSDTLTVTTNDQGNTGTGGALQDIDLVSITVTAVADITADALVTIQNTPKTANLITGTNGATPDTFENGGHVLTDVTQGTNGGVTFSANGDVTYTPNAAFFGVDTFTYTVTSGGVIENATVTVTVVAPPQISKAFAADFVSKNGSVNLVFTITNPNLGTTLTQLAFTDQLPVGLNVTDGSQSGCNGTVTRVAATRTISLSGGSRTANGNCQFTVAVTAGTTDGLMTNTTGVVGSLEGGTGNTATDTITVIDPPILSKSFTPPTIPVNTTSTLQFTLNNPNTTMTLTGLSFIDSLPAGVTTPNVGATAVCTDGSYSVTGNVVSVTKPSLAPGAGNNCVFSVTVTGTTIGAKTNTTSVVDTSNSNDGAVATAVLAVLGPPTVLKGFAASPINIGANTTMSFQLTNPNAGHALTGVGFQDALPAGITVVSAASPQCGGTVVTTASSVTFSGGTLAIGLSCTVNVTVKGALGGSWTNTATNVVSIDGGPGANSNTAPIVVVNHAPAGTNNTVTATEDAAFTFTAAHFGFTDSSDAPPQTLLAVKITTLPALGTLTNNNVAVSAGDFIPVADINGGLLKFTPAADGFGTPYTSFTFQVQDNGGDTDLDLSPNTMTVNVTGLNDPPSFTIAAAPRTVAQYAGAQTVLNFATSISAGPSETGQVLTFNISPTGSTGTLTFSTPPAINSATGTLTYTPTHGTYGTATFSVTLSDDAGGTDTSEAQSFTIVVIKAPPLVDLNGDGTGDVFTYNGESGAWKRAIAQGNGTFTEADGSWNPGWTVVPAKFNDDNFTDLFLFNTSNGQWVRMLNDGANSFTTQASGTWWNGWQRFVMDLDADGLSDLFLHDPASGIWFKCLPSVSDFTCTVGYWDTGWEISSMQLNADAYGDLFLFNGTTGRWFWALGQAGEEFTYPATDVWYNGWDLYPGDYNADGLTDLLLHDQGTGAYWTAMNNGVGAGFTFTGGYWSMGWTPYIGDLDADGDSDIFLYHHPTGIWFKMLSNGLGGYAVGFSQTWSEGWTIQVTDLNGDGRADIFLYHPVTGVYYQVRNLGAGDFTYNSGTWNPGLTIVVRSPFS